MKDKLFYFLDPFIAKPKAKNCRFASWKCLLDKHQDKLTTFKADEWKLGEFTHSKQTDSFSCGIICLLIIENIVKGCFNVIFDESLLVTHRQLLYDMLLAKAK